MSDTARRAGWTGCNILINQIPDEGRIYIVKDEMEIPQKDIIAKVKRTEFIKQYRLDARGWVLDVLNCVNQIDERDFTLDQMYKFENMLAAKHPDNKHVRDKIRQQLQVLRDKGILEFRGRGNYRKYNNIIIYTEPRLSTILFLYVKEPTSHVLFIVQTFCYNLLEIRLRKVHNERENMAIYFIDGDNNPKENIKGIELLAAGDEVHIFYAAKNTYYSSDKNRKAIMAMTEAGVFYKKVMSAPNSVDFAISIAAAE